MILRSVCVPSCERRCLNPLCFSHGMMDEDVLAIDGERVREREGRQSGGRETEGKGFWRDEREMEEGGGRRKRGGGDGKRHKREKEKADIYALKNIGLCKLSKNKDLCINVYEKCIERARVGGDIMTKFIENEVRIAERWA